eukprot:4747604-Prymnesium_polylepis.1
MSLWASCRRARAARVAGGTRLSRWILTPMALRTQSCSRVATWRWQLARRVLVTWELIALWH